MLQNIRVKRFPGYVLGFRQPTCHFLFDWADDDGVSNSQLETTLEIIFSTTSNFGELSEPNIGGGLKDCPPEVIAFSKSLCRLQACSGDIIVDSPKVIRSSSARDSWVLIHPTFSTSLCIAIAKEYLKWFSSPTMSTDEVEDRCTKTIKSASKLALAGTNNKLFIRKAIENDIPVTLLPGKLIQYGYGFGARIFSSSLSEQTSALSVQVARNKFETVALLGFAGFQVPKQKRVKSVEQALKAATEFGFPVVLKPVALDQGAGVIANIGNETELTEAHAKASKVSKNLLLENHILGDDFRINVINGKAVSIIHRWPARITGDGENTIRDLISLENQDPRRGVDRFSARKKIEIDDDLEMFIGKQGFTTHSIPPKGAVVDLRANANISTGGDSLAIPISDAHPSFLKSCEDACKFINLDIAGVDVVASNLRKPLPETGGAIIEINAVPQMGVTIPEVVDTLFEEFGLLKVRNNSVSVVFDESHAKEAKADSVLPKLLKRHEKCELKCFWNDGWLRRGLPFDRVHNVIITNWKDKSSLIAAIKFLKPSVRNSVFIERANPIVEALLQESLDVPFEFVSKAKLRSMARV